MSSFKMAQKFLVLILAAFNITVAVMLWISGADPAGPAQNIDNYLQLEAGEIRHINRVIDINRLPAGKCVECYVAFKISGDQKVYVKALITETWSNYRRSDGLFIPGPTIFPPSEAPHVTWRLDGKSLNWLENRDWLFKGGYWYYLGVLDPDQPDEAAYRFLSQICFNPAIRESAYYSDASWSITITLVTIEAAGESLFTASGWELGYIDDPDLDIKGWYPVRKNEEGKWQITAGAHTFIWAETSPGAANYQGWRLRP